MYFNELKFIFLKKSSYIWVTIVYVIQNSTLGLLSNFQISLYIVIFIIPIRRCFFCCYIHLCSFKDFLFFYIKISPAVLSHLRLCSYLKLVSYSYRLIYLLIKVLHVFDFKLMTLYLLHFTFFFPFSPLLKPDRFLELIFVVSLPILSEEFSSKVFLKSHQCK